MQSCQFLSQAPCFADSNFNTRGRVRGDIFFPRNGLSKAMFVVTKKRRKVELGQYQRGFTGGFATQWRLIIDVFTEKLNYVWSDTPSSDSRDVSCISWHDPSWLVPRTPMRWFSVFRKPTRSVQHPLAPIRSCGEPAAVTIFWCAWAGAIWFTGRGRAAAISEKYMYYCVAKETLIDFNTRTSSKAPQHSMKGWVFLHRWTVRRIWVQKYHVYR